MPALCNRLQIVEDFQPSFVCKEMLYFPHRFHRKLVLEKRGVSFCMTDTDTRKRGLLQALKETRGIVSVACQRAGVARRTFYHWLDTDADFKRSVEDVHEDAVDFAESKLLDNIEAGKERSIIFFLKSRGRNRGFKEHGNGENEMISREMITLFGKAYEGKSSRFDDFPPLVSDMLSDLDRE